MVLFILSEQNDVKQLGLGHNNDISLPSRIPNLPQIKQVSCGYKFTACVDFEGFLWSFGQNNAGQLGTGNTKSSKFPQKITNIPPVISFDCGMQHTIIITDDSNLWSCGNNTYGQLCLDTKFDFDNQSTFQQTSFSNIIKVSLGDCRTLF